MIPIAKSNMNILPTPTDMIELKLGNVKSFSLDFKNEDVSQTLNIDIYRKGNSAADYSPTGRQELTGIGPGQTGNLTVAVGSEASYKFVGSASGIGLTANVKGSMAI